MAARTGREFLNGLSKPRELWVGDDKVSDIVSHPAFAGAAHALSEVFDLQREARRTLPDARSRDRRADQCEPHDPALQGRPRKTTPGLHADDQRFPRWD